MQTRSADEPMTVSLGFCFPSPIAFTVKTADSGQFRLVTDLCHVRLLVVELDNMSPMSSVSY